MVFTDGADTTEPTVTARTPAPGATGVAIGADVTATFSEAVQQSTIDRDVRDPAGSRRCRPTCVRRRHPHGHVHPTSAWPRRRPTPPRSTGARDAAGNHMDAGDLVLHHRAPDTTAPTVTGRTPAVGATGVAPASPVTATFSEAVSRPRSRSSCVPGGTRCRHGGLRRRDPDRHPRPGAALAGRRYTATSAAPRTPRATRWNR